MVLGPLMNHAGWGDVWRVAIATIATEPVWMQLALALGAAFAAVMCLEGIRASFFPRRYAATLVRRSMPDSGVLSRPSVDEASSPDRAKYGAMPRSVVKNRKLVLSSVNRHRPLKPRIQRIALVKAPPDHGPPV
jgi:hypothetical protein